MTDASFLAAGYAVLIEDDPFEKYTSTRKIFAPIAYGSKTFSPTQLKMSIYAKEFLAIFLPSRNLDIYFGEPQNRCLYLQTTNQSQDFFKQKAFLQNYGTHVTTSFRSISQLLINQAKTTLPQTICPDLKSLQKKD